VRWPSRSKQWAKRSICDPLSSFVSLGPDAEVSRSSYGDVEFATGLTVPVNNYIVERICHPVPVSKNEAKLHNT
jgi:hypothetical protein